MAVSKVDAANQIENQLPQANIAGNVNFRNIIINGDMSIAQRGTSETGLQNSPAYLIDRFSYRRAGTWTTAEYTMSQDTDVPTAQGFAKSLKIDVTTAEASAPNNAASQISYRIEGQNLQYLKKGTANAESVTLSFWVKSNKTGTYICEFEDIDNTRNISKSYTISSANTWEKKTITFEGDTTGAFDNDNAASLAIFWWLASGSDYTSGTLQTDWGSEVDANRAVGQVNLADSTDNEWYITGVQLEAGEVASDFEFLPYDVNLKRCQRYFQTYTQPPLRGVINGAGSIARASMVLPVPMRATPTASVGALPVYDGASTSTVSSIGASYNTFAKVELDMILATSPMVVGRPGIIYQGNDSATLTLDAEL